MRKKLIISLLLLQTLRVSAQEVRKYMNEFLTLGASPQGIALSNMNIATVSDVSALYYNPAGLTHIKSNVEASFMHSEYFGGLTSFDVANLAIKTSATSALGFGFIRFGADNIPNTFDLIDKNGVVDYSRVRAFSASEVGVFVSYGQMQNLKGKRYIKYPMRWGGTAKVISKQVGAFANAWGFGFDGGFQYQLSKQSHFGITVRDITRTFNAWSFNFTEKEKEVLAATGNEIPIKSFEITNPRVLSSYAYAFYPTGEKTFEIIAEGGVELTFDGTRNTLIGTKYMNIDPRISGEFNYKKLLYFRLGLGQFQYYLNDNLDRNEVIGFQPSLGAGIHLKNISFDYALTELGNFSVGLYSHLLGVKVNIVKKKKQ